MAALKHYSWSMAPLHNHSQNRQTCDHTQNLWQLIQRQQSSDSPYPAGTPVQLLNLGRGGLQGAGSRQEQGCNVTANESLRQPHTLHGHSCWHSLTHTSGVLNPTPPRANYHFVSNLGAHVPYIEQRTRVTPTLLQSSMLQSCVLLTLET